MKRIAWFRTGILGLVVLYIGVLRLPPAGLSPGLDPSVKLGINIFDKYGLTFGTDIVHVYGPLGRLIYPVAGDGRLFHATALSMIINVVFLALMCAVGFRTKDSGRAFIIIAVFLFYAHFQTAKIRESHLLGIPLLLYMTTVAYGWLWPAILAAILSGFFIFLKFNVAVSLFMLFWAYCIGTYFAGMRSLKECAAIVSVYALTFAGMAILVFPSTYSLYTWFSRSWRVAAGNSEIMSRSGNQVELILAITVLVLIIGIAAINSKRTSFAVSMVWLSLVGIPVFMEFKHGFVRAGTHVIFFFGFVPVAVSSAVLLFKGWKTGVLFTVILVLCSLGPGVEYDAIVPWNWRHVPDYRIFSSIATLKRDERIKKKMYTRKICRLSVHTREIEHIGTASVDLLPYDITDLLCGQMYWKPSPFYQHFLIRDAYSDSITAAHYSSSRAADYVLFRWSILDAVHPMYWNPETHRSIFRYYRPVSLSRNRFLLSRSMPRDMEMIPIGSLVTQFDETVDIPYSSYPVFAKIYLRYSVPGKIIKGIYRVPPVHIQFNDGYVSRIVPGTAENGLLCNYIPKVPEQLMSFYSGISQRPLCPQTTSFRVYMDESLPVFKDEIRIEFEEMRVFADMRDPHETT